MEAQSLILQDIYTYAFGALCVAVYAYSRFNTPATWRSTTTSWQYTLALAGYTVAALALWFVLAKVIDTNPILVKILTFGSLDPGQLARGQEAPAGPVDQLVAQLNGLSAQLASAIILTVLLPRFPILWKLDATLQRVFRELGAIPRQARQLSAMLQRASYSVPPRIVSEVRGRLQEQGLDPDRILQSESGTPEWQWTRIVALMAKLEDAVDLHEEAHEESDESSPRPALRSAFIRHRELEYLRAKAAYQRQSAVAAVLLKSPGDAEGDQIAHAMLDPIDGLDTSVRRLQQSFRDECKQLLKDLTRLISCGVLRSHFSLAAAYRELGTWGFGPLHPTPRGISANDLIGIMLAITFYLFVLFLFIHGGSGQITRVPIFALTIGLTMTAAVICALYPKKLVAAFGGQGRTNRNFALYLLSGTSAVGCWAVIHYVRIMLTTGKSFSGVLEELYWWYPVALLPFVAAFAIAWMTDDQPGSWGIRASAVRWCEALLLAGILAGAAYVAVTWLRALQLEMPIELQPPGRASLHVIVLVQAGVGFIIGGVVPHLCRKASLEGGVRVRNEHEFAPASSIPGRVQIQGAD